MSEKYHLHYRHQRHRQPGEHEQGIELEEGLNYHSYDESYNNGDEIIDIEENQEDLIRANASSEDDKKDSEQIEIVEQEYAPDEGTPESIRPHHLGESDHEKFPEGGRGWLVVAGAFLVMNITYGFINAFGEYQAYYETIFPTTRQNVISLISSVQTTMVYLASFAVVPVIRHLGLTMTLAIGSFLMVFSLMMMSLCTQVWQLFLSQGILYGIGSGMCAFTSYAIPSEWFKERRALAIGIAASGSSLGGIIWPIVFHRLNQELGFAWTNRILGFIFTPITIFFTLAIKSRIPHPPTNTLVNLAVLKDYRFALICLSNMVGFFGLFCGLTYITTFAISLGIRASLTPYILSILSAASAFGRIIPGQLGDMYGRINVLIPCAFVSGAVHFAFWLPARGEALVILFALSFGFFSGAYISLFPACVGQLFGIKDNRSRLSLIFLSCVPGSLTGTLIGGSFLPDDRDGIEGYNKLIIFAGSMMIVSGLILVALRISISRKLFVFV